MARVARASRGSKQEARTIAYALARPLRGLRRGFEVGERLGHLFPVAALRETDENLTEKRPKMTSGWSKIAPRTLLGPLLGLLGLVWGLLGLILGLLGLTLGVLGHSRGSPGALGSLWGPSWRLQNRSRRPSRRPPSQKLDFRSLLRAILAPFLDPPDLENRALA